MVDAPSLFHSIYRAAFSAQRSIVTLATFDIINILRRELPQVGCRMSTVASLAGVSSGKMSAYMNEVVRVPHDHEKRLRKTWAQLKKLAEYSRPLPLDFGQVGAIRQCIEMMEGGQLHIAVFEHNYEAEAAEHETSQQ